MIEVEVVTRGYYTVLSSESGASVLVRRLKFGWSRSAAFVFLGCVAASCAALLGFAPPALAEPSCGYGNYYAGALKTGADEYGVRGYITSTNLAVPLNSYNISAQNMKAIAPSNGIEVGWFVGYNSESGGYDSFAHAYTTLNGPHFIAGPKVGEANYWYAVEWSGSDEVWSVHAVHGGSLIWGDSQPAYASRPGTLTAVGEVTASTLPMSGEFTGDPALELFDGSAWHDWGGLTLCASSGFTSTGNVDDLVDYKNP